MEQLHSSGLAGLKNISHPNNTLQYRGGHTDVVMTLLEAGAQVRLFSYIARLGMSSSQDIFALW